MPHTAYPTAEVLTAFLRTVPGLTLPDGYDFRVKIESAIAEWERETGYAPFHSTGIAAIRPFDPPGPKTSRPIRGGSRILRLRAGLLSISSLTIGCDNPQTQQILTLNSDYFLWPSEAAAEGKPYTAIEFAIPQWGWLRSIQINGVWGYSATVPDDAYEAIIKLGASKVAKDLMEGIMSSPSKFKQGDEIFEQSGYASLGDGWRNAALDVLASYCLITAGR